jgi:hypothetical protein
VPGQAREAVHQHRLAPPLPVDLLLPIHLFVRSVRAHLHLRLELRHHRHDVFECGAREHKHLGKRRHDLHAVCVPLLQDQFNLAKVAVLRVVRHDALQISVLLDDAQLSAVHDPHVEAHLALVHDVFVDEIDAVLQSQNHLAEELVARVLEERDLECVKVRIDRENVVI